jgi:polyvinyl alcohol dehydrogenase (cytochrome)
MRQRARFTHRSAVISVVAALVASLGGVPAGAVDASCATDGAGGGNWPMFGHDITGTRNQTSEFYLDATRAATLEPRWVFDANRASGVPNNEVTGYPIVAQGCVFVGSSLATFGSSGWVFAMNADNGELVWRTQVNGGVYSTLAYDEGVIYAFVSRISSPYVAALDADTGDILWETTVDHQIGADAVASPIVYESVVWVGISGTAAEVNEGDRSNFQGNQVFLDKATGELLVKEYSIPEALWEDGYSGGSVWATLTVDPDTDYGYVGTGNPFDYDAEHENTNALLKMDLDRSRPTFGRIVGTYKGTIEEYIPEAAEAIPCQEIEEINGVFSFGLECLRMDLDFGAMANIYRDSSGRKVVSIGQKSGILHTVDAATMERVWTAPLGFPSLVGGIVGSSAYDGQTLYGPHTVGSYLWAVNKDGGALRWVTPTGSGVNWGPPVTYANRVLYTVELDGFLDTFDAGTGAPLGRYPLMLSPDGPGALVPLTDRPPLSWGGVSVARHTVYVSAGVGLTSAGMPSIPSGYVIAFKPRVVGPPAGLPVP